MNIKFLQAYLGTVSPSGLEISAQKAMTDYLLTLPNVKLEKVDGIGSHYFTYSNPINEGAIFREKLVLDAHADEIGWRINTIEENGLMHVIRNGGADQLIAPSMTGIIITEYLEIVQGVFGMPAIHTRGRGNDPKVTVDFLTFDVGMDSKQEVLDAGINVGDLICYNNVSRITDTKNPKIVGRALDNKIGGFIHSQVFARLAENDIKLPFDVVFVNAVQEEVGLYGAKVATNVIKPYKAIVVDVCHDTNTPSINKAIEGDTKIGEGVVVAKSPAINTEMVNTAIKLAKQKEIKIQRNALGSQTGTNTDEYVYSCGGVPAVLFSIPLRYMHTTVETTALSDVESCIDLIYSMITEGNL